MQKVLTIFLAVTLVLFPVITLAADEAVDSNNLIEHAKEYDGKTIHFVGEAIGDVMLRGDNAWVNVSDGNNAIGVYVNASDAQKIKYLGSYKAIGDTVRVTGVFHRSCAEHGGDLDIHAYVFEVMGSGHTKETPAFGWKAAIAMLLLLGAVVCMLCVRRKFKEQKLG